MPSIKKIPLNCRQKVTKITTKWLISKIQIIKYIHTSKKLIKEIKKKYYSDWFRLKSLRFENHLLHVVLCLKLENNLMLNSFITTTQNWNKNTYSNAWKHNTVRRLSTNLFIFLNIIIRNLFLKKRNYKYPKKYCFFSEKNVPIGI